MMNVTQKSLFLTSILLVTGFSYAYADTMMDNNMSNSSMMMHGKNMSSGSMMGNNMSGWGNGSMMHDDKMMSNDHMMMSGSIDLSMASPVLGSSSAPVTIVEFGDYQCPECDAWFKNVEPTIKANYIDTNKAKLYFVDFTFIGPDSPGAAQAAYCAGDQGKYWQYHDYLYTNQGAIQNGWASSNNLKSYATTLGLDGNQFNACLDSGKYANAVSHNKDMGSSKGVQGTPTFFIIGSTGAMTEIVGPQPASVFAATIDQASTQAVPEFGSSMASLILVISIVSIIAVSAKTGLRIIPKH